MDDSGPEADSNVTIFPLSKERATELVREAAAEGRFSIPCLEGLAPGYRYLVNHRQIDRILHDGYILEDVAKLDIHGNWTFTMARVCAGVDVKIKVALQRVEVPPHVFVVDITGDAIQL